MKEGDIYPTRYYGPTVLKVVENSGPKCPNCKTGYLKPFFKDFTCRNCGIRMRKIE